MLVLTEIGLQYLMLQKTEINLMKESSIIVNEDGLTFCKLNNYSFLKLDDVELSKGKFFEDWIKKNSINDNVDLVVANNPGLFIPQAIFDQNLINEYYDKFDKKEKSDIIHVDISSNSINRIVYKVSKSINYLKKSYLINSSLIHYQTIIYNYLVLENKNSTNKKLFINIQKNAFDVFLFYGEQLQLVNRFPINGPESFLYFLYFIVEKNELKENEFSICFLGKYSINEEYYKGAKLFHNKINFIMGDTQYKKNSSTPFLIDLHANYFRNS